MNKLSSMLMATAIAAGVSFSAWGVEVKFGLYPTGNANPDIGSQFVMAVTDAGNNQALFKLSNNGSVASTITDVLFYDGVLLGIAALQDKDDAIGGGLGLSTVDFTKGAPFRPDSLPRYPAATFGADRDRSGGVANGIDTGEWLGVLFDLKIADGFDTLVNQLKAGDVFVGLHVQRIGQTGGSDWYRSIPPGDLQPPIRVPDGGLTVTLLGLALVGLGGLGRYVVRA